MKYAHAMCFQKLDDIFNWPTIICRCNNIQDLRVALLASGMASSDKFELEILNNGDWLDEKSFMKIDSSNLPTGKLYVKVLPAAFLLLDSQLQWIQTVMRFVTDTLSRSLVCSAMRAGPALDRKKKA